MNWTHPPAAPADPCGAAHGAGRPGRREAATPCAVGSKSAANAAFRTWVRAARRARTEIGAGIERSCRRSPRSLGAQIDLNKKRRVVLQECGSEWRPGTSVREQQRMAIAQSHCQSRSSWPVFAVAARRKASNSSAHASPCANEEGAAQQRSTLPQEGIEAPSDPTAGSRQEVGETGRAASGTSD